MDTLKFLIVRKQDMNGFSRNSKTFENVDVDDFDRQTYQQILTSDIVVYEEDNKSKILKDKYDVQNEIFKKLNSR